MFDIGFWEIFLIAVLALIVIGPERLPGAARTAGYWVGRARRFVEGVKTDVEKEFDVTEFKRLMHNQEVQINELQQKLARQADFSGDLHEDHAPDLGDDYELIDQPDDGSSEVTASNTDADAGPDPADKIESGKS